MNTEIEITDELIVRYLAGEASAEEAMALHDWNETPANQLHFQNLQKTWHETFPSKQPRDIDTRKAWSVIAPQVQPKTISPAEIPALFHASKRWIGIAASIALAVGIGLTFYWYDRKQITPSIAIHSMDSVRQITLPDNSEVTMNRNSIFSYPENFDHAQRTVKFISGEAFFKVTPNDSKPFVVQSSLASVKVVGTAFNVILQKDEMEVSVDEGKVFVYTLNDSVYLEPGYTVRIQAGKADLVPASTSDRNKWAYATHKFVFHETTLNEVFSAIEKAQQCSIKLDDQAIGNCKLTATFESVSTDYILTLITEAMNLSVTKNDKTFTVAGAGCY